jgi:hypothetical protein
MHMTALYTCAYISDSTYTARATQAMVLQPLPLVDTNFSCTWLSACICLHRRSQTHEQAIFHWYLFSNFCTRKAFDGSIFTSRSIFCMDKSVLSFAITDDPPSAALFNIIKVITIRHSNQMLGSRISCQTEIAWGAHNQIAKVLIILNAYVHPADVELMRPLNMTVLGSPPSCHPGLMD